MKILSINSGSSSLKFQLFEMPEEKVLISGVFERISLDESFYTIKINGNKIKKEKDLPNHNVAFSTMIEELIENKVIENVDEIKGVGHRGALCPTILKTTVIDEEVLKTTNEFEYLAPLHTKWIVAGIKEGMKLMPNATHTILFDNAFFGNIKEEDYLYPIPYELSNKYLIKKLGAHGTSHRYVSLKLAKQLNKDNLKLIICHIGNGASVSAVNGKDAVDCSIGYSANSGLMMGTRCGDIDPFIITDMMDRLGYTKEEAVNVLNKQSGLLGISGVSSDSRDIEDGIEQGNERCVLAQKMFVNRIVDYIAKYYVKLEGADAICFTAGIGENSINTRKAVIDKLKVLGIKIDDNRNNVRGEFALISSDDSKVPVYVVPTSEELMIATDTMNIINNK